MIHAWDVVRAETVGGCRHLPSWVLLLLMFVTVCGLAGEEPRVRLNRVGSETGPPLE